MIQKWKKQVLQDVLTYVLHNGRWILMLVSLLLGILSGSLFIRNSGTISFVDLSLFFHNFTAARNSASILSIILHSFLSSMLYLFLAYCSGLFVYGIIPAVLLPFIKGLGIGAVCGYLYQVYALKGVAFSMLVVIPAAFLYSLILAIACKEALQFSASIAAFLIKGNNWVNVSLQFKKYNLRFMVLLLFTAGVSIIDGILSRVFIGVFGV